MRRIRGAGGGKGGGAGSSRSAVEARDSLRSIAYARVLDLISEGEIEGLVDGAKSVYLDGTPLQSAGGQYNFSGASFVTRNGTQGQAYMPGFPAVESETAVGVEVTKASSVVRTLTNPNLTAVRVTVGIPQLTSTNTTNGDTNGTSVALAIDVQSNGGGYVAQMLGREWTNVGVTQAGLTVTTGSSAAGVQFVLGDTSTNALNCGFVARIDYRKVGAASWTTFDTRTLLQGLGYTGGGGPENDPVPVYSLPQPITVEISGLEPAAYEARVVKLSGNGNPVVTLPLAYNPAPSEVISGKTTTRYQRSYLVPLTGSPPWDIRVRRLTADSATQWVVNKTWWDSYTEIIDSKLRYPNSALVGLEIDSSQFQQIPQRGYDVKLLRVKVPSNYDPLTRTYSGVWNGTFTIAWTDNPAWCFYDMLTNARYGLGAFVPEAQVDKWTLYSIAQYCDQLVPNGFGGTEPRFTCNLYLQQRDDAFKVLNDMASIFRAMIFWASGAITAAQDAPADAAYLYTPANVIDGLFTYSGSSARVRHTVALVTWNDPADLYRAKVEYVEDATGIARYGVVQTEVHAVGCTSRGQAHRVGRWLLFSERLESDVVSFKVGLDGAICRPGQIIKIADPARAGVRMGGRILSATTSSITLDASVTLAAATTYTLAVITPAGVVAESTVTTGAGTVSVLAVSPAFAVAPDPMSVWVLSTTAVLPQTFRVLTVTEDEKHQFTISALESNQSKYASIETGVQLESRSISVLSSRPASPTGGLVTEELYEAATDLKLRVTFSWDAVEGATSYAVRYRLGSGNYVDIPLTGAPSVRLDDAQDGEYSVQIVAINAIGYRSSPYTFLATVLGKTRAPADVTSLQVQVQGSSGLISWDLHPDLDVRLGGRIVVRHSSALTGATWSASVPVAEFAGAGTSGQVPLLTGTYLVRALDTSGVYSANAATANTTAPELFQFNAVATATENPTFSGTKVDMIVVGSSLLLGQTLLFDDIVNFDAYLDTLDSGIKPSGTYTFAAPIDIGAVYTCRVTADILIRSYDTANIVDGWASVDGVTNIDGVIANDSASIALFISTTNDNPAGAPLWTDWRLFNVGDYTARGFRFRLDVARGVSASQQVAVDTLAVTVDVPDRVEGQNGVAVGTGGATITFAREFFALPAVAVTAQDLATGDYVAITSRTTAGFTVQFKNSAGTGVARTMDWIAKGYGYKGA